MDIRWMTEFAVLADTCSFWTAAERLYISESALSKHIRSLEKELGAPLFVRTSRRVELSEFGTLMLPYARNIARLQREYEQAADRYLNPGNGPLNLATIPVISYYDITDILVRFQVSHPEVQINVQEADTLEVREMLLQRKCELAIYRDSPVYLDHDPDRESSMVRIPYCEDRLMAVLPEGHPLAEEPGVELGSLATEYFAFIQRDTMPFGLCMRACREAGFTPQILYTSHHLEAVIDMVKKGSCVSLLFARHVASQLASSEAPGFAAVPVVPEIRTTVCLAYLRNETLSRAAADFIQCFRESCPEEL